MKKPLRLLLVQFGPIGDALMSLAFFDDILTLDSQASLLIITRRNAQLLTDLVRAYPQVQVRSIPEGIRSIPFFLSLLTERWTLLVLGVALNYSFRLKLFFFALSHIPGNRTVGLDDRLTGKGWLPLQASILPNRSQLIIDNFRRLLPYIGSFDVAALEKITTRTLHVKLEPHFPDNFLFKKGEYIVVHLFGMSRWRSFSIPRWKSLLGLIAERHPNLPLVFTGSKKDREMLEAIMSDIPGALMCIDLPILDVAGIVDNAALYIGIDTGITHVAGVLHQKSVIIHHRGDQRWVPVYNPNARVLVNSKRCACDEGGDCSVMEDGELYRRCMYDVSDDLILESVQIALSSPDRHIASFAGLLDEHASATQTA